MTDIAQVRELRTVAALDAAQYEAGARKIVEANKQMAATEAQAEVATEKLGRAINVTERSLVALESKLGGASKAAADLARAKAVQARAEEQVVRALEAGTVSEERAARIRADAAKRVQEKTAALQEANRIETVAALQATAHAAAQGRLGAAMVDSAGKTKLSAHQLQSLSFQLNDVVTGLTSGQRPLQVLAQQGPQITQVFGGVGATFRAAGAALGLIGVPALAAAAAIAVVAGSLTLGLTRAYELDHQLKALKTTLAATGGATGASAAGLQAQAIAFAREPGVSRDAAQQAVQGLAANPLINADLLRRALPTVRDFAAATGKDIPEAAKAMAAALTGGYAAARDLDKQFQLLSVAELQQIRNLEEQGRKGEAANLVLAAMQRQWKGLADGSLTDAARATSALGNAWDNLMDRLANSGAVQRAKKDLTDLLNAAANFNVSRLTDPAFAALNPIVWLGKRLGEDAVKQIGDRTTPNGTASGALIGNLGDVGKAVDPAVQSIQRLIAAAGGGKGALHDMGVEAKSAADGLDPAGREMQRLANMQQLLTTAMANGRIEAGEYAKAMAALGIAMSQVQTPDNMIDQLRRDVTRAGMGPAAGAGQDAAERVRLAGGTTEQQDEARRLGQRAYGAGQGAGLAEQIGGMRAGAAGASSVVAAYAQSTEAGRRAELQLRALEAQYRSGAAAVAAYAAALIEQDAAQRRIEGAREIARIRDEVADTEKLNDALAQGTVEYERQKIAIEAAAKVRQGYLSPEQGSQYEAALLGRQRGDMRREAIDMSRRADPRAQLADDMARLDVLRQLGLSQEAYTLAVRDFNDAAREQADRLAEVRGGAEGLVAGFASAMRSYERANSTFRIGQQIFEDSVGIMSSALARFAETGEISFKRILGSFADMILQMSLKAAGSGLMNIGMDIFGLILGGISGGFGGSFGGAGFGAGAGIGGFAGAFAEGGRPPVGRASIVGEKGWEVFVPDQPGTVYNQQQVAAMSGGGSVTVHNVYHFGATGEKTITRADMVQWANDVERRTQASIVDLKRRRALPGFA